MDWSSPESLGKEPAELSDSLRIIGAGFPRTATMSFALALQILYQKPSLHCSSAVMGREEKHIKDWIWLMEKRSPYSQLSQADRLLVQKKLRSLCAGYVGISDCPGSWFVEELFDTFPDAIVICTTRDPDRWWKSIDPLVKQVAPMKTLNLLFAPVPTLRYWVRWIKGLEKRPLVVYGESAKYSKQLLEDHKEYLRRVTPPGKLHFFDVKDGWEPLCKILNMPIPEQPFPHAHDAATIKKEMEGWVKTAIRRWFLILGIGGSIAAASWVLWKRW